MGTIVFLGDSITDANRLFSENGLGFGYVNQIADKLHTRLCGGEPQHIHDTVGLIRERIDPP